MGNKQEWKADRTRIQSWICLLYTSVGARFSDRVTGNASKFAKNAKILQMDIDPAEINKNIKIDASIIGDVKVILRKLNARLDPINHAEWIAHICLLYTSRCV